MKRKIIVALLSIMMLMGLVSCTKTSGSGVSETPNEEFETFVDEYITNLFSPNNYILNMFFNDPQHINITPETYTLEFTTKEDFDNSFAEVEQLIKDLKKFDYGSLDADQQLNYDIIMFEAETTLKYKGTYYHQFNYLGTRGEVANLGLTLEMYSFNNKFDVESYIAILDSAKIIFPKYVEHEIARQENKSGLNSHDLKKLKELCEAVVNDEDYFLIKFFTTEINNADFLTEEEKVAYINDMKRAVNESYRPAHQAIIDGTKDIDGAVMDELPMAKRPKGKEFLDAELLMNLGAGMDGEAIYKYNTDLQKTLQADLATVDFTLIQGVFDKVNEIDSGRLEELLDVLYVEMKADFPEITKAQLRKIIVDESMQDTFAPAAYKIPKFDASDDPETIIINPKQPLSYGTIAHEGYPGHLLQNVYSREQGTPMIRNLLATNGYTEGWAKYIEDYGYEYLGLSTEEAESYIAYMKFVYTLEVKMDMDVNYRGMSYTDFNAEYSYLFDLPEEEFKDIYYSVQEYPIQSVHYYIAYFQFSDLKDQAKTILGADYSNLKFHEFILKDGPIPFTILKERIKNIGK